MWHYSFYCKYRNYPLNKAVRCSSMTKFVTISLFFFFMLLGISVYMAGVVVTVNNHVAVQDLQVEHSRGIWDIGDLPSGQRIDKKLGKIGEGSNFIVTWTNEDGYENHESFNVYFHDHDIFTKLEIVINDKGAQLQYLNMDTFLAPNKQG